MDIIDMKRIIILWSLFALVSGSFGQDINSFANRKEIEQNAIEVVYEHFGTILSTANIDVLSEDELISLFNEDAVGFYGLEEVYPTPLQLKTFKTSEEYSKMVAEMKKFKEEIKNKIFWINLESYPYGNSRVAEYDLEKQGFVFCSQPDFWNVPAQLKPIVQKGLGVFDITGLKTFIDKQDFLPNKEVVNFVIPVSESKALEIEKLDYECKELLLFDFGSYSKKPIQYQQDGQVHKNELIAFTHKNIRAVFIDKRNGEIVYSTTIKVPQSNPNK